MKGTRHDVLYSEFIENVRIYDFTRCADRDGSPEPITPLASEHGLFETFPKYIKTGILAIEFSPEMYLHASIIRCVSEALIEPVIKRDGELGRKMQSVVRQVIRTRGDGAIHLSDNLNDSIQIKKAINECCDRLVDANKVDFNQIMLSTFERLRSVDDKARMAYLLARIARDGALGYHFLELNEATRVFYGLAKQCFEACREAPSIQFPLNFFEQLNHGVCISVLSNSFANHNQFVTDVYMHRSATT